MAELRYLLDTNVLSAVVKRPRGELARRIAAMDRGAYCTSIVVACELRYGVRKKRSQNLSAKVEQLLANIDVLPLEAEVDHHYADMRVALECIGQPFGHNDLFIAAHARLGFDAGDRQHARVFPSTEPCGRGLAGGGSLNTCTSKSPSSTSSPRSAGR